MRLEGETAALYLPLSSGFQAANGPNEAVGTGTAIWISMNHVDYAQTAEHFQFFELLSLLFCTCEWVPAQDFLLSSAQVHLYTYPMTGVVPCPFCGLCKQLFFSIQTCGIDISAG